MTKRTIRQEKFSLTDKVMIALMVLGAADVLAGLVFAIIYIDNIVRWWE